MRDELNFPVRRVASGRAVHRPWPGQGGVEPRIGYMGAGPQPTAADWVRASPRGLRSCYACYVWSASALFRLLFSVARFFLVLFTIICVYLTASSVIAF